jgi:hypothetical protein
MEKIIDVSKQDYEEINEVINSTTASHYKLSKDDFICYKDNEKIIAF